MKSGWGVGRSACAAGLLLAGVVLLLFLLPAEAQQAAAQGPRVPGVPAARLAPRVWAVAQLHLNFAAFILGVPIFAVIIEIIGWRTGEARYDWLSHEFVKLTFAAFSTTALLGALLLFLFVGYYPKFWTYMMSHFLRRPSGSTPCCSSSSRSPSTSTTTAGTGCRARASGSTGRSACCSNLCRARRSWSIANSWLTFMMSPAGVADSGAVKGSAWERRSTTPPGCRSTSTASSPTSPSAARSPAAYAAFAVPRAPSTDEERAHYDWMGYIGNFVAICAFMPLPFAGYWLGREIYALNQTHGHHDDGRRLHAWLCIIQAVLIGMPLPRRQLLPVARHGAHPGRRALPAVHQVPAAS